MRLFYPIALLIVAVLAAAPFYFLSAEDTSLLEGKAVSYGTYGSKIRTLDPAACGDTTSAAMQGNVYEGLYTYYYLKRPPELRPQLAEALPEVSEDNLTYTFKIKKGVQYHRNPCFGVDPNGRARTRTITAHDFVLQFKRIADSHVRTQLALGLVYDKIEGFEDFRNRTKGYAKHDFSRYDEPLSGVRALDEHTLQIKLTMPFPQLVYVLAMANYCPFPSEVMDHYFLRDRGGELRDPKDVITEVNEEEMAVGTGAYYIEDWARADRIVFVRNPDYRDVRFPSAEEMSTEFRIPKYLDNAGDRVPYTDVRYLTYVAEAIPAWKLFLTKQSDVAGIPRDMYDQVIGPDKGLEAEWAAKGITLDTYTIPVVYWFAFNLEDEVIGASKSLRQAMQLCYNVEDHIEVLFNGRGIRAKAYIPSSFPGYDQAQSPYAKYDPDLARRKLADARAELIEAGVIGPDEDIPTITLDIGSQDSYGRKMGEIARGQFQGIGLNVEIELMDWPTLQEKVHNKRSQMYSMGWHADYPDPENFLQLYYSPNIERGTNNTNYSNPAFDKLYEQVRVMLPGPQRTALYVRMLEMLNEDCPTLLLSEPISFVLRWDWVHNSVPHPIGYGYSKFVRVDAEARKKAGGR